MKTYKHPQGSTLYLYDDGSITKVNKAGKTVSTSATAEKLAAGHGGWVLVEDAAAEPFEAPAAAPAAPAPDAPSTPAAKVLRPMKFKEAPVADLGGFIGDADWVLQQKVDGIRAQLVMQAGVAPWFRNGNGAVLVSSTAAATAIPILKALPTHPEGSDGYTVDGEILGGVFYAFDFVADAEPKANLCQRLATLAVWHDAITDLGLADKIRLLPTARTMAEKKLLSLAVYDNKGEGWIAKRLTGGYDWGQRVEHSLKLKLTTTADLVVLERNRDGKTNMVLGAHDASGALIEVGSASAIGKPDAQPGDVVEVKYLYFGADERLVQPTVLRIRTDKPAPDCSTDQLHFTCKEVIYP